MFNDNFFVAHLEQLNHSFTNSTNEISNVLRQNLWCSSSALLTKAAVDQIADETRNLVLEADVTNIKNWKTSLSTIDPVSMFENSVPHCPKCMVPSTKRGFEKFKNNECCCNLGLGVSLFSRKHSVNSSNQKTSLFRRTVSSESLNGEGNSSDGMPFKPKFGRKRSADQNVNPNANKTSEPDSILLNEEDDKAHKSNVAKLTFKSAREHLLASNPAARRTLGATRKAKAKFVSPMIGVHEEKQEANEPGIVDERLKHLDPKMIELIESEIIDKGNPISWEDIAGLQLAKSVIQEAVVWPLLRPDIFTGLRRPPKGILLFGPPGTGKTLIGKCVAAQCNATFFSISASSLTSKWIGDGEKMVRALFAVARCHQPAVIFIDEIDSLLSQRSDSEHEATRRIKTEFLVQFDGAATADEDRLLIVGATNRPQELDEAARRRLVKRLYIPLPEADQRCKNDKQNPTTEIVGSMTTGREQPEKEFDMDDHGNKIARQQIVVNLLATEHNDLSPVQVTEVARLTGGYSGADMKSLCSEAAMGPVRAVPLHLIATIDRNKVRPVCFQDFTNALQRVKPSVSQDDLGQYVKWNNTYGQGF